MNAWMMLAAAMSGLGIGTVAVLATTGSTIDPTDIRPAALRRKSFVYRHCGPAVEALAAAYRKWAAAAMTRLAAQLEVLDEDDWRPEEYAAVRHLALAPAAILVGVMTLMLDGPETALAATMVALLAIPHVIFRDVRRRAVARLRQIRNRLPFTLDLMALVLESGGGTLHQCLEMAAVENPAHPVGDEFRRVVRGIQQGAAPANALNDLTRRLGDADIGEVVLSITTAEARGLPLREALRSIAERLRTRQVQWMERASEEAKVHITWPAMVVMVGCLIIVAAPLVIGAVDGW